MYKFFFLLTSFLSVASFLRAEDLARIPDARSMAMGECVTTQLYLFNPAVLSFSHNYELSFTYYNKHMMKEMSSYQIGFQCPLNLLDMGFSVSSFGYSGYRDNLLMWTGSKKIHARWTVGMSLAFRLLRLNEMNKDIFSPSLDVGTVYILSEYVKLGFSCTNIPLTNDFMAKGRYSVRTGLEWKPKNALLFTIEAENNSETPVAGRLGVEYGMTKAFRIRAGVRTNPMIPSIGLGYLYGICALDAALAYHHVLGVSPNVTLKFHF